MITAINSITFKNNYPHVNFEGRKENREHRGISNTIKAIPLATLIALSPLNTVEVNAQSRTQKPVQIGVFEQIGSAAWDGKPYAMTDYEYSLATSTTGMIAGAYDYDYYENSKAEIRVFDTDGDKSNFEEAMLMVITPRSGDKTENCAISITGLECKKGKVKVDGAEIDDTRYYVIGNGTIYDQTTNKTRKINRVRISPALYQDLKATFGSSIPCKTISR